MALFGRPTAEDDRKAREWSQWFAQRNPLAIASLVLGLFSFIEFGALIVFGVAGIALGIVALVQLARIPRDKGTQVAPHVIPARSPIGELDYASQNVQNAINALNYERP